MGVHLVARIQSTFNIIKRAIALATGKLLRGESCKFQLSITINYSMTRDRDVIKHALRLKKEHFHSCRHMTL